MATPTAINLEVFELYKRVKAIDPTLVTGLEGSYLEIYKGELDHLEKMYVQSDFRNKVAGSVVVNPNISKNSTPTTILEIPSSGVFVENGQIGYDAFITLNNIGNSTTRNGAGFISQQLFSFNILELLERRYGSGVWKGATTLADKVTRAKAILTRIAVSWYGYGSSPTGNRAHLRIWGTDNNSWNYDYTHTNSTVTKLSHIDSQWIINRIDVNGIYHVLAHADPSNGTVASVINTDYIQLEVIVDHSKL